MARDPEYIYGSDDFSESILKSMTQMGRYV